MVKYINGESLEYIDTYINPPMDGHHSRNEYKALIEKRGGKNVGSISGKTSEKDKSLSHTRTVLTMFPNRTNISDEQC